MKKVQVGLIGASGYTGAELAHLLAGHPQAELVLATASGERVGQRLSDLFPALRGIADVKLVEVDLDAIAAKCEAVFIALGHGKALEIAPQLIAKGVKVIDLGPDFRLRDTAQYNEFYKLDHTAPEALAETAYGLPEWQREKIKSARLIANPGCYVTASTLALAPFIAQDAIDARSIIVDAASGVSGVGRATFTVGTHFPELFGDFKAYNVASHRHTPEIEQGLMDAAPAGAKQAIITFTAHLLPIARGILATCYATPKEEFSTLTTEDWYQFLDSKYRDEPFVRVCPPNELPNVKFTHGSNFCDIGVKADPRTGRLIVISALDNLVKGASGQAVQNLNITFGLEETLGLQSAPVFP